jgi:phosphatidylserine/phosphatidylglycerophosphate/cardiolipin synthase-like enzyme
MAAACRLAGVAGLAVILAACASPLTRIDTSCERFPGEARCLPASAAGTLLSGGDANDADYRQHFLPLLAAGRLGSLDRANGTGAFGRSFREVANRDFQAEYRALAELAATAARAGPEGGAGAAPAGTFDARWRAARSTLYLDSDRPASGEFQFSGLQAKSVEIVLRQIGTAPLGVSGRCDAELSIGGQPVAPGETFRLRLGGAGSGSDRASLRPAPGLQRCRLALSSPGGGSGTIEVRREATADPGIAGLDSLYQRCPVPDPARLTPLGRVFHASRWLSQSCAVGLGDTVLLDDPREAFNAKVEALAGSRLPESFFARADPEAPIDLSRAPALELVYFSYLDFKADFSGRVMERLIRHHARRGTKVRIMVTRVLERDKDRALLEQLAADHPNVQLQEFAWEAARGAPLGEQLSAFHKTHHVKMLATLARDPRRSRVIVGGRNIHDGFLFHEPVDLSRYPNLQQYGKTGGLSLNYYSNWTDFELSTGDPEAVRTFIAHLATIWHRDADTDMPRPFSLAGKRVANPVPGANARHFISVPYVDGRALESWFVDLLDAARQKIEIVNPYLNLTPAIASAFERALDRGVKITIVGRIDLSGDFGGNFLTALNALFIEKHAGRITILEYRRPDVVLHSKILMIDGTFVSVSSVNLNRRSFFHDSENGIAVLDRAFYRRMLPVFRSYVARSRPVDPDVRIPLGYRLLFSSPLVLEAF